MIPSVISFLANSLLIKVPCLQQSNKAFFSLGFTWCKAEQPLWGKELQEKEAQKG